jgi:branched-chain amino acid aminotransferase
MLKEPSRDQVVWVDGSFVPWGEAVTSLVSHHYGVGVFEGVRAYATDRGTAIFRLKEHTDRLFRSAKILNIAIPPQFDKSVWNGVQQEILHRNRMKAAYLRPFVFYDGLSGLSLHVEHLTVRVAVIAIEWEAGAYLTSEPATAGISVRTSALGRHGPRSVLTRAKANGNYVTAILALQEARACGADEALLIDADGLVSEASGANVFMVRDGVLSTPPCTTALEGITRDTILAFAKRLGIPAVERTMTRDEIYVADEVFLTGTAAEVTSVREVDGRTIGNGKRGPITGRLMDLYGKAVRGRDEESLAWLTWVEGGHSA